MKKLDKDEKDVLNSFEQGEWRTVNGVEREKVRLTKIARATLLKKKRINLDIPERDIVRLRAKSLEEGIPFEIFVTSILHKFANGKLIEN